SERSSDEPAASSAGFSFASIRNSVCLRIGTPDQAECSGTTTRGSSPVPGLCAICPATKTKSLQTTAGTKPEVGADATPGGWILRMSRCAPGTTAISEVEIVLSAAKQRSMTTEVLGGM